ncbi:ThuA domain-containing protein [Paenibacillus sp. CF384]|uniref:ThuA domain-containing protein n=1 Tax=Paenibacillus sp. CF384 TaxID=1884382 RepID=UPI0008952F59|nr:ThuA domain-containing protein [Paenibacillus sp. CF384]SDW19834.1 hypothetical protein SAMN05518855_1001621 [Paenibacillus sp. CF384]
MTVHTRKHVLVLGDNAKAPYHPLINIQEELSAILGEEQYEISYTDNYNTLDVDILHACDLFISYTDCWSSPIETDQAAALMQYVHQGGSLLVIHNGISLQSREECAELIGARFTGHPDYQSLEFHFSDTEHPVTRGVAPFFLEEEPYRFEFLPASHVSVLMEYAMEGQLYPAAWTANRGRGRLVYLMPGHHKPSFLHPACRQLIRNSANWLTEQL